MQRGGHRQGVLPVLVLAAFLALTANAAAATFTVNTNADTGGPAASGETTCPATCTLRDALEASNNTGGVTDTIGFDLPGTTEQDHTITLAVALPIITDSVTIDGTIQSDWASSRVTLAGANGNTFDGLVVEQPTAVEGLAINGFGGAGIVEAAVGNPTLAVTASYIGTDGTGTTCRGNGGAGISITGTTNQIGRSGVDEGNVIACNAGGGIVAPANTALTATGNYVGLLADGSAGTGQPTGIIVRNRNSTLSDNVISGNTQDGVLLDSGENTTIARNRIGTSPDGTAARPNGRYGVNVSAPAGGRTYVITNNVIAANGNAGVHSSGAPQGMFISGNNIGRGAGPAGAVGVQGGGLAGPPLGNGGAGVQFDGPSSSSHSLFQNVIANNAGAGISLAPTGVQSVIAVPNDFVDNGGLAIDLGADGVTPNDPLDADDGSNGLQNFPVISSVTAGSGQARIQGTLDSEPNTDYVISFFASPSCDPSGYGEGLTVGGDFPATMVKTGGDGHASFDLSTPHGLPVGSYVTTTASRSQGASTSELSACFRVPGAPLATTDGPSDSGVAQTTLHATVDPRGLATTVYFEYGLTDEYGSRTSDHPAGSDFGAHAVSATLLGLQPATTFHYRVVATNAQGTAVGADRTFTTASPASPATANAQPPAPIAPAAVACVVPKLKGKTLRSAKTALTKAHCKLGKVTRRHKRHARRGRVLSQRTPPGRHLAEGTAVAVVVAR